MCCTCLFWEGTFKSDLRCMYVEGSYWWCTGLHIIEKDEKRERGTNEISQNDPIQREKTIEKFGPKLFRPVAYSGNMYQGPAARSMTTEARQPEV